MYNQYLYNTSNFCTVYSSLINVRYSTNGPVPQYFDPSTGQFVTVADYGRYLITSLNPNMGDFIVKDILYMLEYVNNKSGASPTFRCGSGTAYSSNTNIHGDYYIDFRTNALGSLQYDVPGMTSYNQIWPRKVTGTYNIYPRITAGGQIWVINTGASHPAQFGDYQISVFVRGLHLNLNDLFVT